MKKKYEVVAPNIRRTVFQFSIFRANSRVSRSQFATIQTQKLSRNLNDVITYPLIQEKFAFLESNVEYEIGRQNLELDLVRNKSEKDVAKIVSLTIMRIPR